MGAFCNIFDLHKAIIILESALPRGAMGLPAVCDCGIS